MRKKLLLSGITGFIGSRLAPELEKAGYDVHALVRYVTGRYVLGKNVKMHFADLRDEFSVRNVVKMVQPEYVVNLAAISPVAYSYDHPQEVNNVNYIGSINLAESCLREVPAFKQFVTASTSETYGNQLHFPIKETAMPKPNSPYAVAKAATDMYLEYMRDAYGFPVTILKPFNTYGRSENVHFVTERIIDQMLRGGPVRLGDPTPVRDFLYADDHVSGYLKAVGNPDAFGKVVNICTGRGYTIKEWAGLIAELTDYKGEVTWNTIPDRPLDIRKLVGDPTRAEAVLGWHHTVDAVEGLRRTINYLKAQVKS